MRPEISAAIEFPDSRLEPVEHLVRLLVLDTVACAVAGLRHPEVAELVAGSDPGPSTFPGLGRRLSAADTARVFTVATCWDEFCAGHAQARGRPGLHSVGPALVLAAGADVRTVLTAVLTGYDTGARFGEEWLIEEGLHVDGSWGVAAAASAAANAMQLPKDQAVQAVRIAASMPGTALYSAVRAGATSRNLFAAEAVVRGMSAARAAAAGFTGPPDAVAQCMDLLGRDTPVATVADQPIEGGYLKMWPGVRHTGYAIAAALEWRERFGVPTDPLRLTMYAAAVEYTGLRAPRDLLQRQFSATWCAAYALVHGRFDLAALSAADEPDVMRVEAAIQLAVGERPDRRWAELEGAAGHVLVTVVRGGPHSSASTADVRDKALMLMQERLGTGAQELVDFILTAPLGTPWRDCPQ